jgi:hypothetical protein
VHQARERGYLDGATATTLAREAVARDRRTPEAIVADWARKPSRRRP